MSELYTAIRRHYPNMASEAIDRMMGLGRGSMCKIGRGDIPGLKAAEWMIERHPEVRPIYERIHEEVHANRRGPKGQFVPKRKDKRPKMNRMCMAMAGYLP